MPNGHRRNDLLSLTEDRTLRNMYEHFQHHEVSWKIYFLFEKESFEIQTRMTDQQRINTPLLKSLISLLRQHLRSDVHISHCIHTKMEWKWKHHYFLYIYSGLNKQFQVLSVYVSNITEILWRSSHSMSKKVTLKINCDYLHNPL